MSSVTLLENWLLQTIFQEPIRRHRRGGTVSPSNETEWALQMQNIQMFLTSSKWVRGAAKRWLVPTWEEIERMILPSTRSKMQKTTVLNHQRTWVESPMKRGCSVRKNNDNHNMKKKSYALPICLPTVWLTCTSRRTWLYLFQGHEPKVNSLDAHLGAHSHKHAQHTVGGTNAARPHAGCHGFFSERAICSTTVTDLHVLTSHLFFPPSQQLENRINLDKSNIATRYNSSCRDNRH